MPIGFGQNAGACASDVADPAQRQGGECLNLQQGNRAPRGHVVGPYRSGWGFTKPHVRSRAILGRGN